MNKGMYKKVVALLIAVCMFVMPAMAIADHPAGDIFPQPHSVTDFHSSQNVRAPLNSLAEQPSSQDIPPICTEECDKDPCKSTLEEEKRLISELIEDLRLPARREGLDITGLVPVLMPAFGNTYYQVNTEISEIVETLIIGARRARARSVAFEYTVHETPYVVSIVIEAYVATAISRTLVRSVNFCPVTGAIFGINDAVGFDIVPLAGIILMERMRRAPEYFYALPALSLGGQAFFVCDSGVTILFDEFQLSAMVRGVFKLELLNGHILHAHVSQSRVRSAGGGYNITMVPLRYAAEQLGYEVIWNEEYQQAEVWRDLGEGLQLLIWLTPGVNEYHTPAFSRSLEAAPLLDTATYATYVPITFFEQILPLSIYNIDESGNFIFIAYVE